MLGSKADSNWFRSVTLLWGRFFSIISGIYGDYYRTSMIDWIDFYWQFIFFAGLKSENPLSPDYVPSVFSCMSSPAKRQNEARLKKYLQRQAHKKQRQENIQNIDAARSLLALSVPKLENRKLEVG